MIESDRACAEEDQSKSQRGCGQGELESVIARQPIVQVHLPDRDNEVHADGESRDPGKESRQNEQAAQELREGRNVAHPLGQTKTCHEFGVLMQQFLNGLPEGGLIMCHPGFVDETLVSLDPLTTQRENEHAFLASADFPALLAMNKVTLD